mgnify:CR=1 FL=1
MEQLSEHTYIYKGYGITIYPTDDARNPREYHETDGVTMTCRHGRYTLGDGDVPIPRDRDIIQLPLYLYDHSGLTMSTSPFACPWDSGQVGVIWVKKSSARRMFNWTRLSPRRVERVYDMLRRQVTDYDAYLSGEQYDVTIEDEDGQWVDEIFSVTYSDAKFFAVDVIHSMTGV